MPICRICVFLVAVGVAGILPASSIGGIAAWEARPAASGTGNGARSVITWTPSSVEEALFPGDTHVITVSFTASNNIRRAEVTVSPALAPFLRPDRMFLERLRSGTRRELNLIFAPPADARPATYTRTVALVRVEDDEEGESDNTLARGLVVALTIRRRPVATAEWSTYQHDAQRTGRSPHVGPIARAIPEPLFDVAQIRGDALAVGPDRRIFVGGDRLVALNPDGSLNADTVTPTFVSSEFGPMPAVITRLTIASDGTIYASVFGTALNDVGGVFAFNADGTLEWQHDTRGLVATPTLGSDGTIYLTTSNAGRRPNSGPDICSSRVMALGPDGTQRWEYGYGDCTGFKPLAVAPDGTVLATTISGHGVRTLDAHDPSTGVLRWSLDLGLGFVTAPSVSADGTVYVATDRALYAIAASTGKILWIHSFPNPIEPSVPSIAADGTIVVASDLTIGLERTKFAMLESFTPAGDLKRSTELAPSAAIAPCQVGGPQVALDADGNAYVSFNAGCSESVTAPLLFGVTADGIVNWTVDGFISATAIVGAPDTLYAIGSFSADRSSAPLYRITSR
jgi:outer membrane protein assembly factor BamB